jgi:uncharacterized protein (TIGR00369 family)
MTHFERLIKMYAKAPIHTFYKEIKLSVEENKGTITLPITPNFFHGGMSTHGSVYFKLLDDAAYFACQSVIEDYFIVTTNFNISLLRPITKGKIMAIGKMDFASQQLFTATAELFDERGRLCGKGQGQFMKSKLSLSAVDDY